MAQITFYDILGVYKTATTEEIKDAYRQAAKKYHPDLNHSNGAAQKFKVAHKAYAILSDPLERKIYDESLVSVKIPKDVFSSPQTSYTTGQPTEEELRRQEAIKKHRFELIKRAVLRIIFHTLATTLGGYVLISFLRIIELETLQISFFSLPQFGGILAGFVLGFIWSLDRYFKIETFIPNLFYRKMFKHFRTAAFALAFVYLITYLWSTLFSGMLNLPEWATLIIIAIALLCSATFAADGEMRHRIRQGKILEILVLFGHNFLIGLSGACLGIIIGLIFFIEDRNFALLYLSSTVGFIFAILIGAIAPEGLSLITSQIEKMIRSLFYVILLLVAFALGLGAGVIFALNFNS